VIERLLMWLTVVNLVVLGVTLAFNVVGSWLPGQ
jgi:hypothetical protein